MRLSGKTALVTGGTDGIGAELIRQLRAKGATIVTCGRNPERVAAARTAGFEVIEADLSTLAGVEALIAGLEGRPIDILVNNAGVGADHDFREGPPDLAVSDAAIFLNLNAPIHLITWLMPMLRSRPEATIVNVTSGLAIAPRAGGPVYCATKAGLRSYTQALRAQLKDTAITVIEALPPVVETKMTAGRTSGKMPAAECARQIVSAVESGAAEANVGMVKMLQLAHSLSPALARRIMLKF
ncbi:SDR family oxidoreductase [Novosphingobium sp. Gsoil 351]|uniref:SDR family oxidoreductase n=1 Tax=Novosphingobium sp. Gsoil 351 TaxID=2675225 RepID=UPI0012B447CB|nr:SDR family NAD(P)-dependent oxidoreductase [Novosphingobium sp. Gsoil 351]QGN53728.1 SDR family NAD(P)-dependent oxidoreductase [Novosphingobium sp. Gsoil 351]